jgi:UDP-N-acetylmuramate: L-alanyl-gamma-D-glutamyl-meso-diaminopimelate ligase
MRVHFIAIGGSAMHNIALAVAAAGHEVTGSDDQIFEPSRSRLEAAGLLPNLDGWFPEKLDGSIDVVVLGMSARPDNPELLKAQALDLHIQSYPEFLRACNENAKRVVIGGSHGKTTITSMLLHAMKGMNIPTNFMVGAQLEGFNCMVEIDPDRSWCILEGDEYLSSPIDRRPKFFWYEAHFTLLTGVAWDHINVFPTEEKYVEQFDAYLESLAPNARVVWCAEDATLKEVVSRCKRDDLAFIPYRTPVYSLQSDGTMTLTFAGNRSVTTHLIGTHNIQNLAGARSLALAMGLDVLEFDKAIASFKGAARRLEPMHNSHDFTVFRDFAHAPSKVKATVNGVKASYPDRTLTAVLELHTFSSLNKDFLHTYAQAMASADEAVVYYDPAVLAHKRLPPLEPQFVAESFGNHPNLRVITDTSELQQHVQDMNQNQRVVLLMSSGWFSNAEWSW